MRNEPIFLIVVDGLDITARINGLVQAISVQDRAGRGTDTASIVIDDSAGNLAFPQHNAAISIWLGLTLSGVGLVFSGTVDEVRSSASRSGGRVLHISAGGIDTSGKAKEPQERHFDGLTVLEILTAAGATAGITDVRVDPDLAGIVRAYEHMDNESFIKFGERLADEIGGVFKIRNEAAIMAKKGAQRSPSGDPLPPVLAIRGENLLEWDVAPYIGRKRYRQIRVRFYDKAAAKHDEIVVETDVEGSDAIAVGRFEAPTKELAQQRANALKAESERQSGVGSVAINGNPGAQPEALCQIIGARLGIDGGYIIEGVDHVLDRGSGYITRLQLANPA